MGQVLTHNTNFKTEMHFSLALNQVQSAWLCKQRPGAWVPRSQTRLISQVYGHLSFCQAPAQCLRLALRQGEEAVLALTQLQMAQQIFTATSYMGSITVDNAHPTPWRPSIVSSSFSWELCASQLLANTMLKLFTFVLPTAFHFNVSQPQTIQESSSPTKPVGSAYKWRKWPILCQPFN